MERDATWLAMKQAAEHLSSSLSDGETLEVLPRRRSTGFLTITEGLICGDNWTDVFEPVRKRRHLSLSRTWVSIQSVEDAAHGIEVFLRKRPDLGGCGYCRDASNRTYHLEQLSARPGASDQLKKCPQCGALWECPAFGRDDWLIPLGRARRRYPDADLP